MRASRDRGNPGPRPHRQGDPVPLESIVLGDGGARHTETLRLLVEAGARVDLTDREGRTPLVLARSRGYDAMVRIIQRAGAR